jgi:hypothetical protein
MSATQYAKLFFKQEKNLKDLLVLQGTDYRDDSAYDAQELSQGIKEELEHTTNKEIAKKIAKDHLDEDSRYYSKLERLLSKTKA